MPRVYSQIAAKDYPEQGIKKGDTYYKWSFRYGGTHKSLVRPRPSQLTQSQFYGTLYSAQENLEDAEINTYEDFESAIDEAIQAMEELRDETTDKRDNMPENLYDSPTGELLQERVDSLEELISGLEDAKHDADELITDTENEEMNLRDDADMDEEDLRELLEAFMSEKLSEWRDDAISLDWNIG